MPATMITAKGQTTIPKEIRDHLNLHPGDRVDFVIKEDGKVFLEPATLDVKELRGILYRPGQQSVTIEEMDRVIRERLKGKQ